jgi:hypothetical protein
MPDKLVYHGIVYAVVLLTALAGSRHPVVAADAELLVVLTLGFAGDSEIALCLHWPQTVIWSVALAGTLLAPQFTVAVFSATLLSFSLGLSSPWTTTGLFLLCSLLLRVQSGRWTRSYWDPQLQVELRARGVGMRSGRAVANRSLQVFFSNKNSRKQRMLIRQLRQQGVGVEEYPGGTAGAEVPARIVRAWRRPWERFFRLQPDEAFANRTIGVPPIKATRRTGNELEEVASRLRSYNGKWLPGTCATGKGIVLAVLDTGVNPATGALKNALIERVSRVPHEPDPDDRNSHGTAVASCSIAVAPDVKVISVKVLDSDGSGTLLSVLRGLLYVAENRSRIHIVNLSLGMPGGDPACPLCRALQALANTGVASCCAAGNSGANGAGSIECPGASPGTLGVGAVDTDGRVARFSSRGPSRDSNTPKPDLCCFGVDLRMPDCNGGTWTVSGTSFAAPLVAGVLAGTVELVGRTTGVSDIYQLVRRSCTPAAFGYRDPELSGAGIANLARIGEDRGVLTVRRAVARPSRIRKLVWRTVGLATALSLFGTGWWFGLDHVGKLGERRTFSSSLILVGRVLKATNEDKLLFDDGSGVALLEWHGDEGTAPDAGGIFLLHASGPRRRDGHLVLEGGARLALVTSMRE